MKLFDQHPRRSRLTRSLLPLALLSAFLLPCAGATPSKPSAELAFSCSGCPGHEDGNRIFTIRSDGNALKALARSSDSYEPRWSPSGELLAVSRGFREIRAIAADGSSARRMIKPPGEGVSDTSPSWSPDGGRLVFVRATPPPPGQGGSNRTALWTSRRNGRGQRPFYAPRMAEGPDRSNVVSPEFSHTGTRIAFNDVSERLWVVRADGTHPRRLGPPGIEGRDPRWSPDDSRVAFLDVQAGSALRILDLRTNRISTLPAKGATANLAYAWSPDGGRLAIARSAPYDCGDPSGPCPDFELWIVSATGLSQRRVFRAQYGEIYGLDWRPWRG